MSVISLCNEFLSGALFSLVGTGLLFQELGTESFFNSTFIFAGYYWLSLFGVSTSYILPSSGAIPMVCVTLGFVLMAWNPVWEAAILGFIVASLASKVSGTMHVQNVSILTKFLSALANCLGAATVAVVGWVEGSRIGLLLICGFSCLFFLIGLCIAVKNRGAVLHGELYILPSKYLLLFHNQCKA